MNTRLLRMLPILLLAGWMSARAGGHRELLSPDGRVRVSIDWDRTLQWSVSVDGKPVLLPSEIGMELADGRKPGDAPVFVQELPFQGRSLITVPVPAKRKTIPDVFHELTLRFRGDYSIAFRAYDDGAAYRFITAFKQDSITIRQETARFRFPTQGPLIYPAVAKRTDADIYHTSYEENYTTKPVDSIGTDMLAFTPVLYHPVEGPRTVVTESDIEDYPGMYLRGTGTTELKGEFPPYPLATEVVGGDYKQRIVTKRADFIARTAGARRFPWRVVLIAREDRELPVNDLVYRLASPSKLQGDLSWIHPGKGTDEWIIAVNLFNVPFRTGVNTASYKYYIDFAKRFGFQRIMLDAGWSDPLDMFKMNPDIDMDTISAYAREKGIKLSMWTLAMTLDRQLEPALERFNKWGVDFIMTDFMDRDDQPMVRFYERIAKACADHKLMIMFHGAYKPAGFERTWPNAVTREAVLGSEYNAWSDRPTPAHNLILPFTRMTSGPLEYEPGILDNATAKTFRPIWEKVMSQGTRCHQAAMFVVYDSPLQLFSGNPSQGLLEPAFMELIGAVPTTWDTTLILSGNVGEHIVSARKHDKEWWIGAMTDWTARDLEIDLSFLGPGDWTATVCKDGVNADRHASDYVLEEVRVKAGSTMKLHLAPGGGQLIRFSK